jgi:hypothetical protein
LYVDTVAQGLDAKASCVAATTADITLSGTQTVDGIVLIAGNRVLVKNQTLSQNNGIYLCAAGAWTRTTDADTWDELTSAFVFIETGTVNADTGWVCTANAGGTLGTTALPWSQFSGAGSYTASTGLTLTGTVFSLTAPVTVALGGTNATSAGIASFNNITGYTASGATGTTSTNLVFSTSPTLTSPTITGGALNGTLGATTPSSVAATTGTFSSTLGVTGVATLGNGAILGTPASGTVTNLTGTASININGTVGATTPSTVAATTISGTTGTFTGHIATSQNLNDSASLSCTNASSGTAARARVLLIADAGNAQVFATSTGYTDITGAADSMVFAANSLSGGYQFSIDGAVAVAKITSTGINATAIGATTPSTVAATTISATGAITATSAGAFIANTGASVNSKFIDLANTAGVAQVGVLAVGQAFLYGSQDTFIYGDGAVVGTFSSTGLAVTGALSATSGIENTTIGSVTKSSGGFTEVLVGAATGGFRGAGTANFAADIYKNNTAYTNPDYVFEKWATGSIVKYADKDGAKEYDGLKPLSEVEAFAKEKLHLPRFGQNAEHGIFSGSDALLASVEEAYLYLFQQDAELQSLRKRLAALEAK